MSFKRQSRTHQNSCRRIRMRTIWARWCLAMQRRSVCSRLQLKSLVFSTTRSASSRKAVYLRSRWRLSTCSRLARNRSLPVLPGSQNRKSSGMRLNHQCLARNASPHAPTSDVSVTSRRSTSTIMSSRRSRHSGPVESIFAWIA